MVAAGLHIGCVAADAPHRRAVPPAPQPVVEFMVYPRISFCPGTVEATVRVREPGPEWDCVAENFWWGDGDRSGHTACDPGVRWLRVYSDRHIFRRSGVYVVAVEFTGIQEGRAFRLYRDKATVEVRGGLRC